MLILICDSLLVSLWIAFAFLFESFITLLFLEFYGLIEDKLTRAVENGVMD